jgi:hypothetical protein
MLKKTHAIFCAMMVSLFLGGCASNVDVAKKLSEQNVVAPEEGILVAKVVNASGYRLPINQLFVDPKDVNASKKVKSKLVYSDDKPVGDSNIFAVSMKPGEYSLSVIRSFIVRGEGYYSRGTGLDPEFGVFKIEAGQVTDLGTIIYYPKPQDERYMDIAIRIPETADGSVLRDYHAGYYNDSLEVLTWDEDDRDDQRFSDYASAAQNPIVYADQVMAPDGSIYFLGKLGVILRYSTDDGFETMAVDTNLELNTFAQNEAGDRVVGGYAGDLFFQNSGDEEWTKVAMSKQATIHHVSFYQENMIDVVFDTGRTLTVMRLDKQNLEQQQILNTYTYALKWAQNDVPAPVKQTAPKPHNIKNVTVASRDGAKVLKVSGYRSGRWSYFDSSDVETYEFSPDDWVMLRPKNKEAMDAVLQAGAKQLGIKSAGFWSWTGSPSYFTRSTDADAWTELNTEILSCDEGKTLKGAICIANEGDTQGTKAKKEDINFVSRPWFWTKDDGLAIVNFSSRDFWTGESSSSTEILMTNDGGKSWTKSEAKPPKEYCSTIVGEFTDRLLLSCSGATTDFYESTDNGQTWDHIRQQQDF